MERDANVMRQGGPMVFSQAKHMIGVAEIADYILKAYREMTQSNK